jgi:Protein of unknown function (DUF2971)
MNEGPIVELWKHITDIHFHDESILENYYGNLYHYTNANGIIGILNTQKLWATEIHFLNDAKEYVYSLDLINDILQKKEMGCKNINFRNVIQKTYMYLKGGTNEIYVCCFCEDGDLLSQWKGYSEWGNGYSIGFDVKLLPRINRKFPYVNISIMKVVYDKAQQEKMILEEVNYFENRVNILSNNDKLEIKNDDIHEIAACLASSLKYYCSYFKNYAFREEQEWRAIYRNSINSEEGRQIVKLRAEKQVLKPYLELDIGASAQKKEWSLPIQSIIVGPSTKKELCTSALEIYKLNNTKMDIKIIESKLAIQ